ncbi:hypothetical protein Cri9333_0624 [Crinalium epipsammum PCC 9333]|uniref:Uncharacterized protein n=1 Tax=Crinalium epipsammum PCC 9333 TaxID=1173022 RepID=K9VVR3_9CYAN|nr:hypothetical protein [Crinalium epipsammum]AFZ11567.1 hypothetical protein Cri9333_0624 [Crinalium epipsammum PCC 9333]
MNQKVLQCHSRGDKRYSPFCCNVKAFGENRSIENHYQSTKLFQTPKGLIQARDWREAKLYQKPINKGGEGYERVAFVLPNGLELGNSNNKVNDLIIQYYIAIWWKYLRSHPELIQHAQKFDEFTDPFKGKFPFCQADVIRLVAHDGVNALKPMCKEILELIKEHKLKNR